ncbi:MAG: Txe/YoeB family addiction module toxin [Lachnospiraceae bacterium]|nr:Txe/YoeB family addiction module toxin [Lachnospiraceae bacterium]MCI9660124.1 Txe/YoeB family addiction module toxin [Lachnospiraceae bacterium]NBH96822.1 Txe/YoeB family addiction module toxin [Lachnospiraceae bacterium]NBI73965.1 Txe/YoeB family addiction module toxin [Lachnospiraceae bacterium]RKK00924.1 Txe/YoeB family addiction module toxin [Anaerotruncus sp. 1XD22-93]
MYAFSRALQQVQSPDKLIKDIQQSPFKGLGHPEPLSENLAGWWSRRIDEKNRIVYKTIENNSIILSCKDHYTDK